MKLDKKNILIGLAGILLVQVLILVLLNIFSFQNIKLDQIEKPLVNGVSKENIVSFEIKDKLDSFVILKKDGKWMVNTENAFIPGNSTKITEYLNVLSKLSSGIIIDKGGDTSSDKVFGFEQKQFQKVIVKTNNKKDFTIAVGSTGSKRGTSYIRLNDEKKVREISSTISSQTNNQPIDWAEKNIFDKVTENDVMSVEISSKFDWYKGDYKLTSKEEKNDKNETKVVFSVEGSNKTYDVDLLKDIVKNIVTLNVSEYKLNGNITGRDKIGNIRVILKNGKNYLLDFYKADKDDVGNFIVDVDFNDYLYLIHEDAAKKMFKNLKEIEK
ncbi:MAG TPA: DUF4340 domain-containing protein [Spirochaetota bacterium]|nr:DUF4340 domain-containing protein [Spirochaetota bacterium]